MINSPPPYGRLVRICGALAAGAGVVALLGWSSGLLFLASLGSGKIPMAPSTALLFVLYGVATVLRARLPLQRGAYWLGVALNGAGALVAVLLFFLSYQGIYLEAERLGFAPTGAVSGAPIGHMSPATALGFLVASLSLLASLPPFSNRTWRAIMAWGFACLLLVASSVLLLAYLYGTPLLYGGSLIPPAASTTLAFAALGIALAALAGPQAWPRGESARAATRPASVLFTTALVLLAAGVITAGYLYFRSYEARYRVEMERQLSAVAELKVSDLAQYRKERLGDGSILFQNAAFAVLVQRAVGNPADREARAQLRVWLGKFQAHYQYDRIYLLDVQGAVRMSVPESAGPIASVVARRAAEALRSGEMFLQDFYRDEHDQRIYLTVLVPVLGGPDSGQALGVLALRIDPEAYLYPVVRRWPIASQTAEALLIRRDGNDALFLNELKFRKNTALTLRIPMERQDVPAVEAALGREGIVEGVDYRGVPVIADVQAVPGSPWFLVARMDASEVYAPLRERMWMTIGLICTLLSAAGAATGGVWRHQRSRFYREQYEAERDRAWLRNVIERSVNEIYVFDPETLRFSLVNMGACHNVGYTAEELTRLTPLDIKPEFTDQAFRALLMPLCTGERKQLVFETIHRRKDGSEYPVEVHLQYVDAGGRPVFLAIIIDITERRRAEAGLRESEEKLRLFRTLVERTTDAIEVIDPVTGRFLDVNERACLDLGYSREELLALSVPDIDPTIDQPSFRKAVDELRRSGVQSLDGLHRRKNGSTFPVEVNIKYVRLDRDYVVTVVRDITARRLRDEVARLQSAALNAAVDAVVITDRAGLIQWTNPAFTELTGYTAQEATGRTPGNLLKSGEHASAFYENMWETLLAKRAWVGDMINRRKAGGLYTERQSITPILDASGAITHFVAIKRDVSERRQLEAQFRQAQKMEVVGQLAGGIAHDFNNLLTVINGVSDLVLTQLGPDDPVRADVQEIRNAGERAAGLTGQLLAFSRQQVFQPRVVNLNTLAQEMESLLRRVLGEDIELVVVLAPDLAHVKGDPGQLEQVITNLAVNARDAMPEGGRLTIETQTVATDAAYAHHAGMPMPPGPYVVLTVSDSGSGMDEATRARVFDPFFTTKGPGRGTGLGLSTAFGIVKQSHGFIEVHSEVGQGTIFKIYLPGVTEAANTDRPTLKVRSSRSGTETILLVEDNPGLRMLAARVLGPAGYTVLEAVTGEEALRLMEQHEGPVHLLLSDLVMPGMGGGKLAERLAQSYPGMKVLFMSGYTNDAVVRHGLSEGQVAFLGKPFTVVALLDKVREVLDSAA
jgi:PAS domain S-box-containing protein